MFQMPTVRKAVGELLWLGSHPPCLGRVATAFRWRPCLCWLASSKAPRVARAATSGGAVMHDRESITALPFALSGLAAARSPNLRNRAVHNAREWGLVLLAITV